MNSTVAPPTRPGAPFDGELCVYVWLMQDNIVGPGRSDNSAKYFPDRYSCFSNLYNITDICCVRSNGTRYWVYSEFENGTVPFCSFGKVDDVRLEREGLGHNEWKRCHEELSDKVHYAVMSVGCLEPSSARRTTASVAVLLGVVTTLLLSALSG